MLNSRSEGPSTPIRLSVRAASVDDEHPLTGARHRTLALPQGKCVSAFLSTPAAEARRRPSADPFAQHPLKTTALIEHTSVSVRLSASESVDGPLTGALHRMCPFAPHPLTTPIR